MTEDRLSVPLPDDMPLDQAVPSTSKYLSKEDCEPPILVQIHYMATDQVEGDNKIEPRAVLYFHGDVKPFIVNQTNKELLKLATGAQTPGQLKGKQVVLYSDPTIMFGKKMVGGVRVRAAQGQPAQQPDPAPTWMDPDATIRKPIPAIDPNDPHPDIPFPANIPPDQME